MKKLTLARIGAAVLAGAGLLGCDCPSKGNSAPPVLVAPPAAALPEVNSNQKGYQVMTDFEVAKSKAKVDNKPMMLIFSGTDWCPWCVKLENEILSKPEFQNWAQQNVVVALFDFPRNKPQTEAEKQANNALARQYDIEGFPTVVLTDADGKVIARTGYQRDGAAAYVEHLKKLLKKN